MQLISKFYWQSLTVVTLSNLVVEAISFNNRPKTPKKASYYSKKLNRTKPFGRVNAFGWITTTKIERHLVFDQSPEKFGLSVTPM